MNPILVVNDDAGTLIQISKFLKQSNYFHIAASSAEQALTMTSGYDFQLVILDLKLKDMDGDELYLKLLEAEGHYELPVLALIDTLDSGEVEVLNRFVTKGIVTLLPKPLDMCRLEDVIKRHRIAPCKRA